MGALLPSVVFNVWDYGALRGGTMDVSAKLQETLTAGAGAIVLFPPGIYRCDDLVAFDGTTIIMHGAVLERHAISGSAILTLGARCRVEGGEFDGRSLGGGGKADVGLAVAGVDCLVNGVTSHDHYADGIRVDTADRSRIVNCTAYDNGTNPGPSGTGDGFFVLNSDGVWLTNCDARDNARTGLVANTYNGNSIDATLSHRVRFNSCRSEGNGYNDVNMEGVSDPIINDLWADGDVLSSDSNGGQFSGITIEDGGFYAEDHDHLHISHVDIRKANSNSAFFVRGLRPRITDVKILGVTGPHTSNAFEVRDATDELGTVHNVHVDGANNAVVMEGVVTASGFDVQNVGNVRFWVKHGGQASRSLLDLESITDARVRAQGASAGSSGYWYQGDIVYDSTPSAGGTIGWVCTSSGSPGTWKTFGTIAP